MFKKIKKSVKKIGSSVTDSLFGTKPKSEQGDLLNEDQQAQLAALTDQNTQGYGDLFGQYRGMANSPQNDYSRMANWEGEFNQGVVNPALNQMNQLIGDTKHSSNLHSSANRFAQDRVRQNTMDNLSGMRYNQMMTERGMEMQGQEAARQRQLAALTGLSNLSGQALGVNPYENVVQQGQQGLLGPALMSGGMAALFSDRNLKEEIRDLDTDKCVEIIEALPLHSYKYIGDDNTRIGWIAQEVEEILPEGATEIKGYKAILPDQILAAVHGAVKHLLSENKALKDRVEALEGGI